MEEDYDVYLYPVGVGRAEVGSEHGEGLDI
jgi:hypothetical protein